MNLKRLCALCRTVILAENDSSEHIIPNAIGGRKIVRGFLCNRCNNSTGAKWDSELAKQLQPMCNFLNIRRQRGNPQPITVETVSGQKFLHHPDGRMARSKTEFSVHQDGEKTTINIKARSPKELEKLIPGLIRKYPQL